MLLTLAAQASRDGKIVIYVQDLLNKNHRGLQELIKKAEKKNVIIEWEQYVVPESSFYLNEEYIRLRKERVVKNPSPAAGRVDYVITEKATIKNKNDGWKDYRVLQYQLTDSSNEQVVTNSEALKTTYVGGCNDARGYCVQTFNGGENKFMGTSKTSQLLKLIDAALEHAKK